MSMKTADQNTSKSMGNFGNFPIDTTTKAFDSQIVIAVIQVIDGTATVSGKQNVQNLQGKDWYPAWSSVVLAAGTYIVNLSEVTIVASGNTIAHYGG